jgi:hypothetical protein
MQAFFTAEYQWLWTLALGLGLFLPVRRVIWVLSIRRLETKKGASDETQRAAIKRRATFTSALLCFIFSVIYVSYMFQGGS